MSAVKHKNSIVVPIELGRALKQKNERQFRETPPSPTVRRLIQCVEMLADLSREIARTSNGSNNK